MTDNLPGDQLILLGLVFNVLAGVFFLLTARGRTSLENLAKKSYNFFTICIVLASAYLFYLFFTHNFAIKYVHDYSDSTLPFFYLLSAFWGGQEGTYLLWLLFNALFGYIILKRGGQYRNYAMAVYTSVNLFFMAIMTRLSPFAMLDFSPVEGAGLNPLLQDAWMVIHPPIIFVGYAMAAVPFSIAMAALIRNDYSDWLRRIFPWAVITTLMLAAGNILGGYWAYKTLGWGGYWAWDPVENSSFIPWFASLALLHGLIVEKRTGALRKINILLTSYVFLLVVYGTFLTRSGVLADFSVHSFVDLGINQYLVGFMAFFVAMTLILFLWRIRTIGYVALNYNYYNKEFILFMGMALLFLFSIIILFWTSLPILSGLFTNQPRAADLTTYNDFALPFAVLFSTLLTVSPFLNYNNFTPRNWQLRLLIIAAASALVGFGVFYFGVGTNAVFAVIFTVVVTGLIMFFFKSDLVRSVAPSIIAFVAGIGVCLYLGITNYAYILFLAAAAMVIISNLFSIFSFLPGRWRIMGGQLTHLGFGLMLIGVLGSSAFSVDEKLVLPRGEEGGAYGIAVSYQGMENDISVPKNRLKLNLEDAGESYQVYPELYFSQRLNGIFRKPFIQRNLLYDLYFSPEQVQDMNGSEGLILTKGETRTIGEYTFTFHDFDMGSHGTNPEMMVAVNIDVEHNGSISSIRPAVQVVTGESGQETVDIPAEFGNDENTYKASIKRIIADQGAVALNIPGLLQQGPPDRLILAITRKPVINLVWIGTSLILLGTIIVFVRRRSELAA